MTQAINNDTTIFSPAEMAQFAAYMAFLKMQQTAPAAPAAPAPSAPLAITSMIGTPLPSVPAVPAVPVKDLTKIADVAKQDILGRTADKARTLGIWAVFGISSATESTPVEVPYADAKVAREEFVAHWIKTKQNLSDVAQVTPAHRTTYNDATKQAWSRTLKGAHITVGASEDAASAARAAKRAAEKTELLAVDPAALAAKASALQAEADAALKGAKTKAAKAKAAEAAQASREQASKLADQATAARAAQDKARETAKAEQMKEWRTRIIDAVKVMDHSALYALMQHLNLK